MKPNMNTILIAVDGSAEANKALDVASQLANSNSSLIVLHASNDKGISNQMRLGVEIEYADEIRQRVNALGLSSSLPDEEQYARTMLSHSESVAQVIDAVAGENIVKRAIQLLSEHNIENISSLVVNDDPSDAIIKASKERIVDTIVMGSRGTGKMRGLLLGSVSQSVLHRAGCTVIIVK